MRATATTTAMCGSWRLRWRSAVAVWDERGPTLPSARSLCATTPRRRSLWAAESPRPGGRPHAETQSARTCRRGRSRGDALRVARTLLAPRQNAALRRRHHQAGIARVVSALQDPNPEVAGRGHAALRTAGIAVDVGIGADEACRVHAGHIRRVCDGRPHVTLKLAISADGKAGLAGRQPAAITGEAARARVHLMRAMNDAILVGIGTALADDPLLTCRLPGMAARSPVRVVLDRALRLPHGEPARADRPRGPAVAGSRRVAAPSTREACDADARRRRAESRKSVPDGLILRACSPCWRGAASRA